MNEKQQLLLKVITSLKENDTETASKIYSEYSDLTGIKLLSEMDGKDDESEDD